MHYSLTAMHLLPTSVLTSSAPLPPAPQDAEGELVAIKLLHRNLLRNKHARAEVLNHSRLMHHNIVDFREVSARPGVVVAGGAGAGAAACAAGAPCFLPPDTCCRYDAGKQVHSGAGAGQQVLVQVDGIIAVTLTPQAAVTVRACLPTCSAAHHTPFLTRWVHHEAACCT